MSTTDCGLLRDRQGLMSCPDLTPRQHTAANLLHTAGWAAAVDNAVGPNPVANLLDMLVLVSLQRITTDRDLLRGAADLPAGRGAFGPRLTPGNPGRSSR